MQALWLENQVLSFRENIPLAPLPQREARVRVRVAGICGTDLEMEKGYYPFCGVPGHEFVGDVVEAPDDPSRIGQRVVGEINVPCGACKRCLGGFSKHCERRSVLGILNRNGAFAEYLTLPLGNLHRVPESVPDEAAVFMEPLAAVLEIQGQVQIGPGDRVMVVGAGRLGQLMAQSLALTGCRLRVVARHENQKAVLADRDIETVRETAVPCREEDVVVEATGSPGGLRLALDAVRPGGTIVLKSTYKGPTEVDFSPVVVNELRLVGSRCGPFEPALQLLESGAVDPLPLIAKRFPLRKGLAAFQHAAHPGILKVLLEIN
jgi:2-desacetyl-2-hydroxyethyl bacteriochlorophyllide A dehydrogenase